MKYILFFVLAALAVSCTTPAVESTSEMVSDVNDITMEREIDGLRIFPGELYAEGVLKDHFYQQELFEGDVFVFETIEKDTLSFRLTPAEDNEYVKKVVEELKKKENRGKAYKIIYYYAVDAEARRSLEMCDFSAVDIIEIVGEGEKFNAIRYVGKDDKL